MPQYIYVIGHGKKLLKYLITKETPKTYKCNIITKGFYGYVNTFTKTNDGKATASMHDFLGFDLDNAGIKSAVKAHFDGLRKELRQKENNCLSSLINIDTGA
ncbi:hypothetical protein EBU95_21295 [bacterium]|nr:hypothetical protein [bacterium]